MRLPADANSWPAAPPAAQTVSRRPPGTSPSSPTFVEAMSQMGLVCRKSALSQSHSGSQLPYGLELGGQHGAPH